MRRSANSVLQSRGSGPEKLSEKLRHRSFTLEDRLRYTAEEEVCFLVEEPFLSRHEGNQEEKSMLNRLVRYGLVSVFALAIAGYGNVAMAQDDDDAAGGDDTATEGGEGTATEGGEGTATEGGEGTATEGGGEEAAAPAEGGAPPMILAKGKIAVAVSVQVNLSKDFVAKPIAIQPDIFYGVMPKLEVGVAHSSYMLTGFWGGLPGGGICVTGTDNGCEKAFNGPTGILGHYMLMEGAGMDLAADVGVVLRRFSDPMMLGAKLGVMGRKMMGKLMIGFAPNIYVGFTERDAGNKETLNVPVDVMFMASPKLAAGVQTGITGPLDGFGDFYMIPVSLGAMFSVSPNLMAGASFNLLRVAGFEGPGAADLRSLTVFAAWHN
jgi:hypothetical protein